MTSPQVSEAELQHAIDAYDAVITRAADVTHFITGETRREAFCAALTAAAQVRERAKHESIKRAIAFHDEMHGREPDFGPDVLGIKRGEE